MDEFILFNTQFFFSSAIILVPLYKIPFFLQNKVDTEDTYNFIFQKNGAKLYFFIKLLTGYCC